jgi:microcystin-dependent protein
VDHLHGDDHAHTIAAGAFSHAHTIGISSTPHLAAGGFNYVQQGGSMSTDVWGSPAAGTNTKSQQGYGATTAAADRSLAFTSGGPSVGTTAGADRGLTTTGPSTNTSDSSGSGTGHNNLSPYTVASFIIKT